VPAQGTAHGTARGENGVRGSLSRLAGSGAGATVTQTGTAEDTGREVPGTQEFPERPEQEFPERMEGAPDLS